MTGDVRRAGAFFVVGTLSLLAPALVGRVDPTLAAVGTVGPFGLVAGGALATTGGAGFELFARDGDRRQGRLYGLAGFALAAAGLGLLVVGAELPPTAFVVAVFVLTTGNLGQALASARPASPTTATVAFVVCGAGGGLLAAVAAASLGASTPTLPVAVFVAASGALLAGLIRSALFLRDDALVVVVVALVVWLLLGLVVDPSATQVAVGLVLAAGLGAVAYGIGSASMTGTLTGVPLALFAVVLGGYGWFALLVTFFGLGSLSSKFRYEEKLERGIAQADEGARGGGNVLANSLVALVAVVGFAASDHLRVEPILFLFAFAGAVSAALADTFSSEFGGLFDEPRLVTTLEHVEPGTDGGVTWQGALAGGVGAGVIAALTGVFFSFGPLETGIVLIAGFVGMFVDSVLGATLEGDYLDNQAVNLLATLFAALFAVAAVLAV